MNAVVVDTNVVSYLMKGDTRGEPYRKHAEGKTLAVSFMTVAELYEWSFRRNWGERKLRELEERLRNYIVIPHSAEMCRCWGRIRTARKQRPISVGDAWIAATAVTYGCPLVTHNPKDFEDIPGLSVITEMES